MSTNGYSNSQAVEIVDPRDGGARSVSEFWEKHNDDRLGWLAKNQDARRYVTQTSTDDTEVGTLGWKNRTTIPKLANLADTLQAQYMAAAMPNDDWFRWEGIDRESHEKGNVIEDYMRTKLKAGRFGSELEKIFRDWIIYGNCFASVEWVVDRKKSLKDGEEITNFIGPRMFRISPMDVVLNPNAKSFDESPFCWRKIMPITDFIKKYRDTFPDAVNKAIEVRGQAQMEEVDWYKQEAFTIDGWVSFPDYLNSGSVEILEYWGDVFNPETGELQENQKLLVVDRSFVMEQIPNPSYSGRKPFAFSGWRILPDNLFGQGPLDNLLGMQYRCDHLENLKADTFDQIVQPVVKIKGNLLEEFEWGPGAQIHTGIDGDAEVMRPDASVLQADNQIALYHAYMEMYAGVTRESQGFRTPGEKSAFEVNVLQQGADRMFLDRLNHFEIHVVEVVLNVMFELLVRNMDLADVARTFNNDTRGLALTTLTREDVVADGVLRPIGSRHFAARNKRVQELSNFLQLAAHPSVSPHLSGLRMAEAFTEELGFEKYGLVEENIGVIEQVNAEIAGVKAQQDAAQTLGQEGVVSESEPTVLEEDTI